MRLFSRCRGAGTYAQQGDVSHWLLWWCLAQVVFYDTNGREVQVYDYNNEDGVREFTSCSFNPSGDTAVFGTYNRFYVFAYHQVRNAWDQVAIKQVDNFYSVTALAWKPDGSKLTVGGMTGTVDLYDACVRVGAGHACASCCTLCPLEVRLRPPNSQMCVVVTMRL